MQDIAAENNLSETAFFHPQGDAFSLRWFTPTTEVELCGHATLASAFVLMTALEPARSEVTFRTRSGLLHGAARATTVRARLPRLPRRARRRRDGRRVAEALRVQPREVLRARSLFAVLDSAAAVRAFAPDFGGALAAAHQHRHHRGGRRRGAARRLRRALLRPDLRRQRGSGDRLGVLHAGAVLGRAAGKQALRARQVTGAAARCVRARRRTRAHRRQGPPGDHGNAHVLRAR